MHGQKYIKKYIYHNTVSSIWITQRRVSTDRMTVVTTLTACFNNITLCDPSTVFVWVSYGAQNTRPLPGTLSTKCAVKQ